MKKALYHFASLILLAVFTFFTSCKKEGPQGPAGSANVTAYNFSASSWLWDSPYYYKNFTVPALTSSNIDSAAVMVYFKTGTRWIAVPYTQYDSPYDYHMGFNTGVGLVQVTWFYDSSLSSGSDPNSYYSTTVQYKVVVIPPSARMSKPLIDYRDYDAVKKAYNIKE